MKVNLLAGSQPISQFIDDTSTKYDYEYNKLIVQQASQLLQRRFMYRIAKRLFDILASAIALVFLSPLFVFVALIILLDDPHGSPVYSQKRLGQHSKPFVFYKFRSMYVNSEAKVKDLLQNNTFTGPVFKMDNDPRITRVGKYIRKLSIDELPQLWNVLKGEMSVVGPRPPVAWEADEYTPFQKLRLTSKPGLTCYWQVEPKRYTLSFNDYVVLDIRYMQTQSVKTDLILILKTFGTIIKHEGQ